MNEWAFGWIIMVRTMKTPTSFHVTNEIISLFERVLLLLLFLLPLLLLYPDELGFEVRQLTKSQLRRVENKFEIMVNNLRQNSERGLLKSNLVHG